MNNDGVIEKDDRPAEKKKHDLKPPCFCKMRKCHEKISEESRIYLHDEFRTLNYKDRKQWICSHVMEVHPTRRSSNEDNRRNFTRKYFLPNSSENVR